MYLLCQHHVADTGSRPVNGTGIDFHPFLYFFIIENSVVLDFPNQGALSAGFILAAQNLITDLSACQFRKCLLQLLIVADNPVITIYNIYLTVFISR